MRFYLTGTRQTMALILSKAARLKPEIRLAQALSEYAAILSDDQKAKLRGYYAQSPPNASDVMRLTAEIDRDEMRTRKSRRCVGPRLSNVLQACQQFATVVDVAIGGSQQPIASGIWGVLKLSLQVRRNLHGTLVQWLIIIFQVASAFSSYFDQLSSLFMAIGRSCPRNQEYVLLYPRSPRLQAALCEYFVAIVGLCKQTVLFLKKSFLSQLSTSIRNPFQTEFGSFQQQLDRLADSVREEASLESRKIQEQEAKGNSMHRALVARSSADDKKWRDQQADLQFLNVCSTYDHRTPWKQARKQGSVSWLYHDHSYQQWKHEVVASTLYCYGTLGSGKSVLAANVVDNIVSDMPEAIIAYFFCRDDDTASLTARSIIGSIARQIFEELKHIVFKVRSGTSTTHLDTNQVLDILLAILQANSIQGRRKCIIVLDGLDECEEKEIRSVLDCLQRLIQSRSVIKVFCATRSDTFRWISRVLEPQWTLSMMNSEARDGMERYVEGALEECLETESLSLGNPEIILTIRDALVNKADGM